MQDVSYLVRKEDPYDLENPASTVRSCTVPKDLREESAFARTIPEKVSKVLTDTGTLSEAVEFDDLVSILEISKNTLGDAFTLTILVNVLQEAEDEEVYFGVPPEENTLKAPIETVVPVRIVYNAFPEIEVLCDLDINRGLSNEIISVRETDTAFIFESRRFGHGVGMSQRGAQWMAEHYGKTCDEILAFYYPGLVFSRIQYQAQPTPSAVSGNFLITPGPPASPTPRPTLMPITQSAGEGIYIVTVENISTQSYLNLRSEPGMNGIVLRQLYYGQQLVVLEEAADGWLHVKTDSCEGYVMQAYVEKTASLSP